jgi:hypothetical protein
MRRLPFRMASASLAAATVMAMTIGPAAAAPNSPYVFDSLGSAHALKLTVGLPEALADGLRPVLEAPGVELVGNTLEISLSGVLTELAQPLEDGSPGALRAVANADTLAGSLDGVIGAVSCLDNPINVTIPPDAANPFVSMRLLQAECVTDEAGRLTVAASEVADVKVQLSGLLALLPDELTDPLTGALDQIIEELDGNLLDPLRGGLGQLQDGINEQLGLDVDLTEAVRIPELIDLPLVSIGLLRSESRSFVDGDAIRSVSSATLAGVSLLGTICIPDITYSSEAWSTGLPGGNGFTTSAPTVDLSICDTATLSPILRLLETGGVINDIFVNLGSGELRPIGEVLDDSGLPLSELLNNLDALLAELGVSTIVQGVGSGDASADGRTASAAVTPFVVRVDVLGANAVGTPFEGLSVGIAANDNGAQVAAAPEPPADEPFEPALPRTGAGALATMLGVLAMGGALALRREH